MRGLPRQHVVSEPCLRGGCSCRAVQDGPAPASVVSRASARHDSGPVAHATSPPRSQVLGPPLARTSAAILTQSTCPDVKSQTIRSSRPPACPCPAPGSFARPFSNSCGILGLYFSGLEALYVYQLEQYGVPDSVSTLLAGGCGCGLGGLVEVRAGRMEG